MPTQNQIQNILLGVVTQEPAQAQSATAEPDSASSDQPVPPDPAPAPTPPPPQPSLEEKLNQALNDLEAKFNKIREDMAKRQLNESDSLNAVQKMDFQSKLKEFMNKHKHAADSAASSKPQDTPAITLTAPSATPVKN